jgi:hypothetical protein
LPGVTTLYGTKNDLTVSIGFFVLVAGAIAASTLVRGSTVVGVVFVLVAVGLVVLAVVLHRRPATEMRVSNDLIELHRPGRVIGSLSRSGTDGVVDVRRHIHRGRMFWSLVPAGGATGSGIPVDGFVPDEIRSAAEQHGWTVNIVE